MNSNLCFEFQVHLSYPTFDTFNVKHEDYVSERFSVGKHLHQEGTNLGKGQKVEVVRAFRIHTLVNLPRKGSSSDGYLNFDLGYELAGNFPSWLNYLREKRHCSILQSASN